jgi:hypothetical protein
MRQVPPIDAEVVFSVHQITKYAICGRPWTPLSAVFALPWIVVRTDLGAGNIAKDPPLLQFLIYVESRRVIPYIDGNNHK